jgi:tRNA G37 N-methylase Trm5
MSKETKEAIIKRRKYRKNIKGDVRSLYISSYPVSAKYLAKRIGNKEWTLVELCCGIGVTLEYAGKAFKRIIGVDINKKALSFCEANLKNAGLKAELIQGDVNDTKLLKLISADVVIYDIPNWYGEDNPDLKKIINKIRRYISGNIVIFAPPTYAYAHVKKQVGMCEFQKVFIDGKYDRNHVFLGDLIEKEGITKISLVNE